MAKKKARPQLPQPRTRKDELKQSFPRLKTTAFKITSAPSIRYNCIAWAADDDSQKWWPSPVSYWPLPPPFSPTLDSFLKAFATLGYVKCDDDSLEPGFDKIAFYGRSVNDCTHAAKQRSAGGWWSKLGNAEDIHHELDGLSGDQYGFVLAYMKRPQNIAATVAT